MIDLDFDDTTAAQSFLERLEKVWSRVDLSPALLRTPEAQPSAAPPPSAAPQRARITLEVEARVY